MRIGRLEIRIIPKSGDEFLMKYVRKLTKLPEAYHPDGTYNLIFLIKKVRNRAIESERNIGLREAKILVEEAIDFYEHYAKVTKRSFPFSSL
jgi:hypothetical protein